MQEGIPNGIFNRHYYSNNSAKPFLQQRQLKKEHQINIDMVFSDQLRTE